MAGRRDLDMPEAARDIGRKAGGRSSVSVRRPCRRPDHRCWHLKAFNGPIANSPGLWVSSQPCQGVTSTISLTAITRHQRAPAIEEIGIRLIVGKAGLGGEILRALPASPRRR